MLYTKKLPIEIFHKFQKLIYEEIGVHLSEHKISLVQTRLRKWLIKFHLDSYEELYQKIKADKSEQMLILLANAITTNVTSFFREDSQWEYLLENLNTILPSKKIRIWSNACSSGEEPYSIIIFLKEHLVNFESYDIKILATDISHEILLKAQEGVFQEEKMANLPKKMLQNYFIKDANSYIIKNELKKYITFRSFNLVKGNYKIFTNYFDIIYCRNVMIYFDKKTQEQLLLNFTKLLKKNSRLFVGHSESIQNTNLPYQLVLPSVYKLKENYEYFRHNR